MLHFRNVRETQVQKKYQCCYLTSLPNNRIDIFSVLEISKYLGNEANRHALTSFVHVLAKGDEIGGESVALLLVPMTQQHIKIVCGQ